MDNILEIHDVCKHFKDVKAVDGVNLVVPRGEFVALLGPNGAGKSTLVEMIEGIQVPDRGQITIAGMNWKHHKNELHKRIGISLQENHFMEKLTVYETVNLFASLYNLPESRVEEVIELVKLQEKRKALSSKLSGGQKQRMALAIAMLNQAELLLLDEPTTGLDPTARHEIWDILSSLHKEHGLSMILTTHYMEEAEYLCSRIVMMNKGKILAQGTLGELLASNNSSEIIEFSLDGHFTDVEFLRWDGTRQLTWDNARQHGEIHVASIVDQLPVFLAKVKEQHLDLSKLECRRKTLDDLFIEMTGTHLNATTEEN